jgi:hypothetical protein
VVNLSIIIINYKSLQLISDCLKSIYSNRPGLHFEIIIVNNDEKKIENQQILQKFPEVNWVDMEYNSGFARANNGGIRRASGEVILLLNPDTIIPEGALDKSFQHLIRSEYVACGVQLLNEDSSPQISGNYFIKGGLNYLLPLPYTGKFIKWLATALSLKTPHVAEADSLVEVDWINGAFLMVKKWAVQKAGLMDEDFFLYAEEAEWCARLKKIGKLCIFGSVHVFHLQGITANEVFFSKGKGYYNLFDRKGLQIILSNLVRIRKQYGVFWFLIILMIYTMNIPVFFTGILFSNFIAKPKRLYTLKQCIGFTGNVFFVWSKSAQILSNRPYFYKVL